jgi:hypothetical protein
MPGRHDLTGSNVNWLRRHFWRMKQSERRGGGGGTSRDKHDLEVLSLEVAGVGLHELGREALARGAPAGGVIHSNVFALQSVLRGDGAVLRKKLAACEQSQIAGGAALFGIHVMGENAEGRRVYDVPF